MKRWLIGSLALNVLLIGIGAGFLVTAAVPRPPQFPPLGPRPGIQRDLLQAAETALSGTQRTHALEILNRNFQAMGVPSGPPPGPRAEDILRSFVEGHLPEDRPFADPKFEERRKREVDALHGAFDELVVALDRPARQAFAEAIRARMMSVRACLDAGPPPRP